MTIKIAIFRPRWAKNNTTFEVQARLYAYLQQTYGLDITIFADVENRFRYPGLNVEEIRRRKLTWYARLFQKSGLISKSEYQDWRLLKGYDVIETSDPTLYDYAYTAYKAANAFGSRLLCGSSVTLNKKFETDFRQAKQVMDFAYKVGCCTPKAEERFVKLGVLEEQSSRAVILGHPIDVDLFRPRERARQNETVRIISVGRLDEEKGHHILLQAIANLYRESHKIEWEIIGRGGREDYLKHEVGELGLSSIVQFHGLMPNNELPGYYAQADIFALHQLSTEYWEEYFGVVLAEAMSCGLPIVSTNTGGIPYVVKDGETGYLIEQRDVEGLTTALQTLAVNEELRKRMGQAGRKHVVDNFAMDVVAQRYLQLWGINQ